jgi:hypothetical protein
MTLRVMRFTIFATPLIGPDRFEFTHDLAERKIDCTLSGDNENVYSARQISATTAEKLPHKPFDPISNHRVAHLATDRDPQPSLPHIIGFGDNDEIGRVGFPAASREPRKFGSFSQAGRFRKDFLTARGHPRLLGAGSFRRYDNRQSLTSFGPTPLEDFTPTGGFHTG